MEDNYYDGDYYERHSYNGGHWSLQRVAFEFTNGRGRILNRCNFVVNPSSMQYNYPDRNVFVQTLGRYPAMQGYGAGLHTIQISGQTGYHKTAIINEGATGPHTNYGEAKHLKRLLIQDEDQARDDFAGNGTNSRANSQLHFMNYTDGDCYQVELSPQGIQFSRTNNDPLTYYYSITMTVIRKISDPLPSEMTLTKLGNDHNLFPRTQYTINPYNRTYNINVKNVSFNALFSHPITKLNKVHDFLNGRGSILNLTKKKNIKNLESKDLSKVGKLSKPQKAQIMTTLDEQTGKTHTIDLGPFNVKVGGNTPKADMSYWNTVLNDNTQVPNIPPLDIKNTPAKVNKYNIYPYSSSTKVTPAFTGVTDGHGVHVLVPTVDFKQYIPQHTLLPHAKAYYNKRFFKNTKESVNNPLSNLVNGNLTVSKVITDNFGRMTVEPLSPHMPVKSYQNELVTITDQDNAFIIQPNQYSPSDIGTPISALATNISSDYVQFYRKNNQLILIANNKGYSNPNNEFILSDINNQLEVTNELNPKADNWAKVSLKAGNIYIQPSGPEELNGDKYYMQGQSGSHTILGNNYMILSNDNDKNTVFDSTENYSADTDVHSQVHYGVNKDMNIRPVTVNGSISPIKINNNQINKTPIMNSKAKYISKQVNPDIIQGQTYKEEADIPKGDDDE